MSQERVKACSEMRQSRDSDKGVSIAGGETAGWEMSRNASNMQCSCRHRKTGFKHRKTTTWK